MAYVVTDETLGADLAYAVSAVARLLIREGVHVNRTSLSVLNTLRLTGPRRITDLAACEYVSQPGMTGLVTRLEDEGWVERRPDDRDGRVVNVAITKTGRAMVEEAIAARGAILQRRVECLGARDRAALAKAAEALLLLVDPNE